MSIQSFVAICFVLHMVSGELPQFPSQMKDHQKNKNNEMHPLLAPLMGKQVDGNKLGFKHQSKQAEPAPQPAHQLPPTAYGSGHVNYGGPNIVREQHYGYHSAGPQYNAPYRPMPYGYQQPQPVFICQPIGTQQQLHSLVNGMNGYHHNNPINAIYGSGGYYSRSEYTTPHPTQHTTTTMKPMKASKSMFEKFFGGVDKQAANNHDAIKQHFNNHEKQFANNHEALKQHFNQHEKQLANNNEALKHQFNQHLVNQQKAVNQIFQPHQPLFHNKPGMSQHQKRGEYMDDADFSNKYVPYRYPINDDEFLMEDGMSMESENSTTVETTVANSTTTNSTTTVSEHSTIDFTTTTTAIPEATSDVPEMISTESSSEVSTVKESSNGDKTVDETLVFDAMATMNETIVDEAASHNALNSEAY